MDLEIHKISSYYPVFEFTRTFSRRGGLRFNPDNERGTRKQPAHNAQNLFSFLDVSIFTTMRLQLVRMSYRRSMPAAAATRGHGKHEHLRRPRPTPRCMPTHAGR